MKQKNTSRTKGRAVFLVAIMIMSVFAVPIAFTGGVAAFIDDVDEDYDREVANGNTVYQGQIVIANVSVADSAYTQSAGEDLELRRYISGDNEIGGLVQTLTVEGDANEEYVIIETENRDTDQYVLTEGNRGSAPGTDEIIFEVVEQQLTAEFDEETAADVGSDAIVDFEIDSEIRNAYAVNVSADGLDDDELVQIFQLDDNDENEDVANRSSIAQAVSGASLGDWATIDDDDEVLTLIRGEDEWELNFTGIDEGEYEFVVEVVDTTASATATITVEDRDDGELDVSPVDVFQGDIAVFEVELSNTESGALVIGNEDDDGYQANISIQNADSDTVTVYFNTYTAGNVDADAEKKVFADSDDADVTLENSGAPFETLSSILDTGDYEVVVASVSDGSNIDFEAVIDDPDTITTLAINERSELDAAQWRAGSDTIDDLLDELNDEDEAAAIELIGEAVANDLVTQTDMFAVKEAGTSGDSDFQIHQISANGLEGLLGNLSDASNDDIDDFDTTAAFGAALLQNNTANGDGAILLEFEQQNPGANRDAIEINLADAAASEDLTDFATVVFDGDANDYYIIIDTDALVAFDDRIEEDQEYEVTFAVQDQRLLDEDDEDDLEELYEEITWEFELEEAEGDFLGLNEDGDVEVEAADNQELTVETNVAPGTELDIRARNKQGTSPSFIKTARELVVSADGTVTGVFDFSAQSVDDEFTTSVRQASFELSEDGIIVEASEEPVEEEPVEEEPEEEPEEPEEEPEEEEPVEETEDDTPGFGALVALLAILGAALLAARRQN